jgi:hypothetical protein
LVWASAGPSKIYQVVLCHSPSQRLPQLHGALALETKEWIMKLTVGLVAATLLAIPAASAVAASPETEPKQMAFLHESYGDAHAQHHRGGCFVTTSAHHHTKQVSHWRNPCPHHERRRLNPYHPPHHRPHHPHPARHF